MLGHQLLDGCERLSNRIHDEIEFTEDLAYDTGKFFIRAEK
jgi:hypothetical protein